MEEEIFASEVDEQSREKSSQLMKAIVYSGITVGVLDGLAATVNAMISGGTPLRVFQYIASGLLGPAAFQGSWATFILGVLLHFVIAFGASAVFIVAGRFIPILTRLPFYLTGPVYGVVVYFFMRDVVIPMSSVTRLNYTGRASAVGIIIHILFVGLPIALMAAKFAKPQKAELA